MRLPNGYNARAAAPQDLDAVVALLDRSDLAVTGDLEARREYLTWMWSLAYVSLRRDTLLVTHGDVPAAFGMSTRDDTARDRLWSFCRVDPAHDGNGLGTALILWSEAAAIARTAPGEPPFPLDLTCAAEHAQAHELLGGLGYGHVRTSWDMARALDGPVQPVDPPDAVQIRSFVRGRDERAFWEVDEAAFTGSWGHVPASLETFNAEWWGDGIATPESVLLAESDGRAVGACGWFPISGGAYVAVLGVIPAFRGRGVATALLTRAFSDIRDAGHATVELTVDASNETGAVELYRKVGMDLARRTHAFEKTPAAV